MATYIFQVASWQKWCLLKNSANQNNNSHYVIQKDRTRLYLLPWMKLNSENSTPKQREKWINSQIEEIIKRNKLIRNDITVLVHATDIGREPGYLANIPIQGIRNYVLYQRDTTETYLYLTNPENIIKEDYLTNVPI